MQRFLGGVLLVVVLHGRLATAQEAEFEDAPAEAPIEASATAAGTERAEEIDELEPGVPSQVLMSDVRRQTTGDEVMDELDLGRTEITGNQELPKVLYIVPWKKSDPGELMGQPANTLLDEVLAPVDRGEFVRRVDYYSDLFDSEQDQ